MDNLLCVTDHQMFQAFAMMAVEEIRYIAEQTVYVLDKIGEEAIFDWDAAASMWCTADIDVGSDL